MKLHPIVRGLWWLILTSGSGAYLLSRPGALQSSKGTTFDIAVLILFAGLVLAPIFSEVPLWGVTLKQHIEETKKELKEDVERLRADVIGSLQMTTAVCQQIVVGPPPDSSLPHLRELIQDAVRTALPNATAAPMVQQSSTVPSQVTDLFSIRYGIEREIRRIAQGRDLAQGTARIQGRAPVPSLLRVLEKAEIVPSVLAAGIRDVYAICSQAIHEGPPTPAQYDFARTVGPDLLRALWQIS